MADQVRKRGRTSRRRGAGKKPAPRVSNLSPQRIDPSAPVDSRAEANQRREPATKRSSDPSHLRHGRRLDAQPDRVDLRDWPYQPRLVPLPDLLVNTDRVPFVLDQGQEGACTGFALAAVVNFLLHDRGLINARQQDRAVSPRMLYEMARRYDEWPGEDYEGSSARGAMKGWAVHGVVPRSAWPDKLHGHKHFKQTLAELARGTPGGAFYRVQHREVRDMHAALHEAGILNVTMMVHDGWFFPGVSEKDMAKLDGSGMLPGGKAPPLQTESINYAAGPGNYRTIELPVIQRIGRAESGHAVAFVGYTDRGFIVQNSWGPGWGIDGFALLPYEDYLLHTTDVWVAQLGVPVKLDLWAEKQRAEAGSTASGIARAATAIPLSEIRQFTIDIGNDGRLSDSGEYWTTPDDLRDIVNNVIPEFAKKHQWSKKRILLYLHGGLNDERGVAARVVAFRDVFLANEIYPVHLMWETGLKDTLRNILDEFLTGPDDRAGRFRDWVDRFREGLTEAKDRSLELTLARAGRALWNEMKENAELASNRRDRQGAVQLLAQTVRQRLAAGKAGAAGEWELHLVGHSAGSIFLAHAIDLLLDIGLPVKTLQFFAPAVTTALFKQKLVRLVEQGKCPMPSLFMLSDTAERDDEVGPYGKSLLYLVSNAFEERVTPDDRRKGYVPLLGMQRFFADVNPADPNSGTEAIDATLAKFFGRKVDGRPSLVVASTAAAGERGQDTGNVSQSRTHGGFDNDYETMNSALVRILGKGNVKRPFTTRDLQY